jgi:Uma2 family endonuclease
VRAPDVLVVSESFFQRNPARIDAGEVLLAVEIISPGTRRTDRVLKAAEYAAAGIPHYWVIDLIVPASITTCTLVGAEYEVAEKATGPVTSPSPPRSTSTSAGSRSGTTPRAEGPVPGGRGVLPP